MKRSAFFFSVLLLLATGMHGLSAAAETAKTPEWFFHDIVDMEFVKQHVDVPMPENVMLIDARPTRSKYDKGHIPMAVNIPYTEFDKHVDKLPKDKTALLIFYCEGPQCKLSHKSARKAEALGYTNVKVFAGGFPRWMEEPGHYAAVPGAFVKKHMDKKSDMVLIDSRPKRSKYDKGHIPGAVSIPDMDFEKMLDQLPRDKETLLVFYCGGFKCRLSHKSAQKAMALGYKNVVVYAAGYPDWKSTYGDMDVADVGDKKSSTTLKAGKEEGSIDPATFERLVKENPERLHIVDVRDADEFAKGSLKTAVNIPVDKLEARIKELPPDKPVVFVCGTGARSGESYYMVKDLRPELKDVFYVEAEMTFAKDGSFKIVKAD
ncbi:MAG: sulfurtransferase [Deltaproteobacteria bacterium]|nr:sulfurtransferase [Deltaproteobacteria bacterium]